MKAHGREPSPGHSVFITYCSTAVFTVCPTFREKNYYFIGNLGLRVVRRFFFLAEAKATAELHVRHDRLTCVTGLRLAFPPSDNSLS